MLQQKILDKIFKILDEQISKICSKSKTASLESEDIHRLETLTRVYSIANSSVPKGPGRPLKIKNMDYISSEALAEYAKDK